jgi:hypothetical protein
LLLPQQQQNITGRNSDLSSPVADITEPAIANIMRSDALAVASGTSTASGIDHASGVTVAIRPATLGPASRDQCPAPRALLNHRDPRATQEHYNLSTSLGAGEEYARIVQSYREC